MHLNTTPLHKYVYVFLVCSEIIEVGTYWDVNKDLSLIGLFLKQ